MRRIRSRLIIILSALVIITSLLTISVITLLMAGAFPREVMRLRDILYGFALKDALLLVASIALVVIMVTIVMRQTASPVRELNRAMREIARGNYDVNVAIKKDRVEEYGELQANFNEMAETLRQNDYLRRDFISNVSHELKTPLAVIQGYADLIAAGGLSQEETIRFAVLISEEASQLLDLSGNMLRLAKLDAGVTDDEFAPLSLDENMRASVIALESEWSAKELDLNIDLDQIEMVGDEQLLTRLWQNLIENAIKFSPVGGELAIRLFMEDGMATATIEDYGSGMDEETLAHCFDRFYQGDTSHKSHGSGLGLSIAQRIAHLHGGKIEAVSSVGHGTIMRVTLRCESEECN